jgi:hypothetical protein
MDRPLLNLVSGGGDDQALFSYEKRQHEANNKN